MLFILPVKELADLLVVVEQRQALVPAMDRVLVPVMDRVLVHVHNFADKDLNGFLYCIH